MGSVCFHVIPSCRLRHPSLLVKQAVNGGTAVCPLSSSHINRRTQFENPVLEAKRRLQQQQQVPGARCQGLASLPLPAIYRGEAPPSPRLQKDTYPRGQGFRSWRVNNVTLSHQNRVSALAHKWAFIFVFGLFYSKILEV